MLALAGLISKAASLTCLVPSLGRLKLLAIASSVSNYLYVLSPYNLLPHGSFRLVGLSQIG